MITRLEWESSEDPDVVQYNIYSQEPDAPSYMTLLATTANSSFDTTHPWAASALISETYYGVTCVKTDGKESFISAMVKNDDRDFDGLTDAREASLQSDSNKADTDGDGLLDGEEYSRGTSLLLSDTDGDTYSDFDEVNFGSDPLGINSLPIHAGDFEPDGDVDGLDNATFIQQYNEETNVISVEEFSDSFGR